MPKVKVRVTKGHENAERESDDERTRDRAMTNPSLVPITGSFLFTVLTTGSGSYEYDPFTGRMGGTLPVGGTNTCKAKRVFIPAFVTSWQVPGGKPTPRNVKWR